MFKFKDSEEDEIQASDPEQEGNFDASPATSTDEQSSVNSPLTATRANEQEESEIIKTALPRTGPIEVDQSDEEEDSAAANEYPPPASRQRVALKKLCTTRWEDHFQALESLTLSYADVIFCLEYFSTEDCKADVRSRAQSLYNFFSKLESVAILCLEYEKLRILRKCSKKFQNKSIELCEAGELLSTALEDIEKIDLESIISKAEDIAKIAGTNSTFSPKYADAGERRTRQQPRHLANYVLSPAVQSTQSCVESAAEQADKAKQNFRKIVLAKDLDITKKEIDKRFESFKSLNEMFTCLSPKKLVQMTTSEISICADNITKKYGVSEFEKEALQTEIESCKAVYSSEISKLSSSHEFLKFLLSESGMVGVAFKSLISALVLYLTLPVTVASAERSFSKLKLIKSHLRSTMLQDRLSGLALMSIERERTKNINIDAIVDRFVSEKKRRKF